MTDSCLVAKLGHFTWLSDEDEALLLALEREERSYRRDEIVRRAGQAADELFVVKTGWVTSFSIMEDGRRQLLKLFYPGDIVDLSDVALRQGRHDIRCVTTAVLCPFPKSGLQPVFERSPRLTALLFALTVLENNALLDRIRAIGRFSAYERVCHLLLEIRERLRITVPEAKHTFRLPLTQTEMADLLGLTNVYVSKTLSRIETDGLIRREGNRVSIRDPERMAGVCEYRPGWMVDTTWFPTG
jgi:CRP-like cAMP-binding protein